VGRGNVDDGLGGLHRHQQLVGLDLLPRRHLPFNDFRLLQAFAQVGQLEVFHRIPSVQSVPSTCSQAATMSATLGRYKASWRYSGGGMSGAVTRRMGACRSSHRRSYRLAAISAPSPPERGASCTITRRPVLRTEASRVSRSSGLILARSITSQPTPRSASCAAACRLSSTLAPQLSRVRSSPSRRVKQLSSGSRRPSSRTVCGFIRYSRAGSRKITGS